jgi:pimeloyl-ACP methyl ester carboxylesterase
VKRLMIILSLTICPFGSSFAANVVISGDKPGSKHGTATKYFNGASEERVTFYSRENISSDKKLSRKGVLLKRPGAKATVLICHGFSCDKYDVSFLHMLFSEYNSMTFDFRAHGEDIEGQECTLGRNESYDVIAASEFLRNHPECKDKPLIVYGFSMGAASAILAQALDASVCDAMILDCPFDSSDKLIDRGLAQIKMDVFGYQVGMPGSAWLKRNAYSPYVQSILAKIFKALTKFDTDKIKINFQPIYPEEAIKYIDVPCFFIACVNDQKAPEEAVLSVYNGAKGYKRCWIDPDGRRHYDTIFRQMHKYFYRVDKFVKSILDRSYLKKPKEKVKKDLPYCVISPAKN